MNREIKFRAWNADMKMMQTHLLGREELGYFLLSCQANADDEIHLMQYTGLKDKNGKEIYEGDIVRRDDFLPEGEVVFEVEFNQDDACFVFEPFIKGNKDEALRGYEEIGKTFSELNYCEIIGNIYKNPELLTKLKES